MGVLKGELNSSSTYVPAQLTKDKLVLLNIDTLAKLNVKTDKCELPTFYSLPKLHKNPFKSRFISNSSQCSTIIHSKHITSALTAVKDHVIKYNETAFSNRNLNNFWSITSTSTVWPSDHRPDDMSCALLFYSLVQIFLKLLHSDL